VFKLPAQGDVAVYRMTLDQNPAFAREFGCRRSFTMEAGDGDALSLATVTLLGVPATVAQGACRVVQNMEPVAPNAAWLREAVTKRLIPAYRRERAWVAENVTLARDTKRGAYDPRSLGPIPGSTATPSSGSNYVGITSSQGGEYTASRGFLHDADARVVDAALHNQDAAITAYWPEFTQYTLYSLAQPQGAVWSSVNHVTADPQLPMSGDKPYEMKLWSSTANAVESLIPAAGWGRDNAHLENTGYVHWLLTEDPIAGLVVQRQAAYSLANWFAYKRPSSPTAYGAYTEQERGIFNTLSVLWKSRVIARSTTSAHETLIWSPARAQKQAADVIGFYDRHQAEEPLSKIVGAPFGVIGGTGTRTLSDGTVLKTRFGSNFMSQQYGKEPLWLWTRDGSEPVRRWFSAYARQMVVRTTIIGGTRGIDGFGGSSISYAAEGVFTPATDVEWGNWLARLPVPDNPVRDSYNDAAVHTALQTETMLLMAKDAGLSVNGLDGAITRMATDRARTTALRYTNLQMMKHLAAPE
jgi:hypothetical protein